MHQYRTHKCNELNETNVGTEARLSGWIYRRREHAGPLFIDLRDHYGITQCVILESNPNYELLKRIKLEALLRSPVRFVRATRRRSMTSWKPVKSSCTLTPSTYRAKRASAVPGQQDEDVNEDLRLKYRYLDLRREKVQRNMKLRSDVIAEMRDQMRSQGFTEFQTPILTASSPEVHAISWFLHAKPRKILCAASGASAVQAAADGLWFDRYFQIAPCFRDEDPRADRSPGEFYQLDFEMSFVTQEDVFATLEPVLYNIFTKFGGDRRVTQYPFPRIPFLEAIEKYGSDKPDLRNRSRSLTSPSTSMAPALRSLHALFLNRALTSSHALRRRGIA